MAMSDCDKCWDTPCTCGYGYQSWSLQKLREQIAMLQRVLTAKEEKERKKGKHGRRD